MGSRFVSNYIFLKLDFANLKNTEDEDYEQSKQYYEQWLKINPSFNEQNAKLFRSVRETFQHIETNLRHQNLHVLVTGSLHLVGAVLSILDPELRYQNK